MRFIVVLLVVATLPLELQTHRRHIHPKLANAAELHIARSG
jgi:hypothetical protein